jgi:two-component system nitrate/nitrite response regulator NarL
MSNAPVFLVGGTNLFRRGLMSFLGDTDFAVAEEFDAIGDCVDALDESNTPEVVIFATSGDTEASETAIDTLARTFPDVRIMVLSAELSVEALGACLKAGAHGYLLSSISKEALVHSLTLVVLGETVFPSGLASAWVSGGLSHRRPTTQPPVRDLTRRETDILECLTSGAANKQIARDLGITEATVKIHMKSLIRKIGVSNRTQAALWAINSGFGQSIMGAAA